MTRVDLQVRLQNHFNNSVYYDIQSMNDSIQDGMDDAAAFAGGIIFKSTTLAFQQDVTYYDMLTLLPDYIGLYAMFNHTINRFMFPTSVKQLDQVRIDWESAYGVPYYFVPINHRYIAIYKKPSIPNYGEMFVYYIAAAPVLTDSTEIQIPDDHIKALESYCIQDLWAQQQEFTKASEYFETYIKDLEDLRVWVKNRRNSDRQMSLR